MILEKLKIENWFKMVEPQAIIQIKIRTKQESKM